MIYCNKIFDSKGNGDNIFIWGSYNAYGATGPSPMTNTFIENNEICGAHRCGIETAGGFSGLTIRNNDIHSNSGNPVGNEPNMLKYGTGILMIRGASDKVDCNGYGPFDLLIENNNIFDNEKNGIYMGPKNQDVTITGNNIYDNGWDAIRVDLIGNYWNPDFDPNPGPYTCLGGSDNVVAHCNNITGSGDHGAQVIGTPTNGFILDATCNWWGDCSGPSGEGPGSGDAVSTYVDFDPWVGSVADAGGPHVDDDCDTDYTIDFDGSNSMSPPCCGGTIVYDWDFGDYTTGTGETPSHIYAVPGEYTVTLTTTVNALGYSCVDTDTTTVTIYGAVADADGAYSANTNGFVQFDGSGSYGYEMPLTYSWDFDASDGIQVDSTEENPDHTYFVADDSRMYTVTLTVTEASGNGCQGTDTSTVYVTGHHDDPPIVQLIHPKGGELLSGTVSVDWFAICPCGFKSIYLFYSADDGDSWRQIGEDLYNNVDIEHGNYQWNTGSLSDGQYMLKIEVFDYDFNIAMDTSDPFTIDNGYAGVRVSDVHIQDTSIGSTKWVKNGDNLEITAGITGSISVNREDISADLSGFGRGTVIADSYDGFTATWTLNNVQCTPTDGTIAVTVTIEDLDSNSATITADNTNPELSIFKPVGGLYFFNARLLSLSRTIIIGSITIDIDTDDNNGIDRAEFYIDGELMQTVTNDPFEWYTNLPKGQHRLDVLTYDHAGNTATQSVDILKFL